MARPGPDGVTVSRARPSDVREVADLWCQAFEGDRTVEDRVRMLETGGRYGGLESVLVLRSPEGELAGAAKIYRLEGRLAGAAMPMMGLAAVAVSERLRRRGYGAHLCTAAIEAAASRGDLISALYPFRPDYYERLGWGLVGELHEYRVRTGTLPPDPGARLVRRAHRKGDWEAIAVCYARAVASANGPISRDRRIWSYRLAGLELGVEPLDDGQPEPERDPKLRAVVYDDDGVSGYALLRHVRRPQRNHWRIDVRELVAEDERAYRALLGHLATQQEEWPRLRHFARPEERFGDRVADPRPPVHRSARSLYFPTARIVRGPMLRVLDVPGALRARPWFRAADRKETATLRIEIVDDQRPENAGPWLVTASQAKGGPEGEAEGEAEVTRLGGGGAAGARTDALLRTGAATFAQVFAGELPPTEAHRLGRARVEGGGAMLDRAFAVGERFWLLDEF